MAVNNVNIKNKGSKNMQWNQFKLLTGLVLGVILLVTGWSFLSQLFVTNDAGYYQVKQAAFTGTLTVRDLPGTYTRLWGNITTYHMSDMHYFSKSDLDGGNTKAEDPIKVQFTDGGRADISGAIKYRLPSKEDSRLLLHNDYKSYAAVKHDLVRQTVAEAMMQTASLMKAEEMYTTRRGEFTALVEEQIKVGIYETAHRDVVRKSSEGEEFLDKEVFIKLDANGHPVIRKVSPFLRYGIEVVQFTIKEIDFDKTIDDLIGKKKEMEQQKVVAVATAEKAKQDAITAQAQGQARIAEAKATQEVEKIKEVTIAQKEFEVSQLRRKQAEQDAQAAITKGKAEADVNKLKVIAGLTPLEKANIAKDTAIGVAKELANVQFPKMMILGGSNGQHALNPFDAVGLESFMRISRKLGAGEELTSHKKSSNEEE
jgi:regulator of protease activity HflC (stomatin/prohibitin superfamily)